MFEATIETVFSAAHALRLPGGTLEPIHGHDWRVTVTVASEELDDMDTVMDFHALQALLEAVVKPWRNRHLNEVPPFVQEKPTGDAGTSADEADGEALAVNPSAERVAERVAWAISGGLPERVWLHDVSVSEAPGCVARFRP